jgi:hypothetical protein
MYGGRRNDTKSAGRRTGADVKPLSKKLSPHFGVFGIFERGPLHAQMTPGLSSMGVGQNGPYSTRSEARSVLRVRADCGGRLFTAKFSVVVHYLLHQLLDDPTEAHAAAVRSAISGIRH